MPNIEEVDQLVDGNAKNDIDPITVILGHGVCQLLLKLTNHVLQVQDVFIYVSSTV